ncbi:MAG: ABC transporter permease [Lachnospiraceae bacterium]|nr:ABC transporter permease [Lachnospiraceae bacterium]
MARKTFEKIYMAVILVFMYAPIVTMIVLSFNESKSRAKWGGFSMKWYQALFHDSAIMRALWNTLSVALISALIATVIGTVTCVALMGLKSKSRAVIMGITNIPMINADIVTGISLMLLFQVIGFKRGFWTVLISHITFNIPFVMLSVLPRLKQVEPSVYEAAQDLGATKVYAFRKTVLPDIMPGVISGALMAFTMSLDDFIITYFTKGVGFDTLSTKIYASVKKGIQPEIYALSAIIFVTVLLLLFFSDRIPKWANKNKQET